LALSFLKIAPKLSLKNPIKPAYLLLFTQLVAIIRLFAAELPLPPMYSWRVRTFLYRTLGGKAPVTFEKEFLSFGPA
jgi:hypothetical protein